MSARTKVLSFGAVFGLIMPTIALTLLWFGVGFDISIDRFNLMHILWPSSRMILVGWHTTALGCVTTIAAILINCLLYMGVALLLQRLIVRPAVTPADEHPK